MKKVLAAVAVAATLNGCASIVSGTTDDVEIRTNQPGAKCVVLRDGLQLFNGRTPASVKVTRSGDDLEVQCQDGPARGRETVESGFNAWVLGNFLLFPPLGTIVFLFVDGITGSWHGYDNVEVEMAGAK